MMDAQPSLVPLKPQVQLAKDHCPKDKEKTETNVGYPYALAGGSIFYAMGSTQPDITYAVGLISRFMSQPEQNHCAVKELRKNAFVMAKGT